MVEFLENLANPGQGGFLGLNRIFDLAHQLAQFFAQLAHRLFVWRLFFHTPGIVRHSAGAPRRPCFFRYILRLGLPRSRPDVMPAKALQSELERLQEERRVLLQRERELQQRCAELATQIQAIRERAAIPLGSIAER